EASCVLPGSVHLKAQKASSAAHLFHGQCPLRVTLQKWIAHAADLGMSLEKLGHSQGILVLPLHSDGYYLDAGRGQPRCVRVHVAAQRRTRRMNGLDQMLAPRDQATDQVRVPAKIFRPGMHHEINAKL